MLPKGATMQKEIMKEYQNKEDKKKKSATM